MGQTSPRHTSEEFVAFLQDVVATQPAEREVHVILDNFSAHKTLLVKGFLVEHPNVNLHFTPTYSSWLSQVESWFQQTPTRCHRSRHIHLSRRSQTQNPPLHPPLSEDRQTIQVEIL